MDFFFSGSYAKKDSALSMYSPYKKASLEIIEACLFFLNWLVIIKSVWFILNKHGLLQSAFLPLFKNSFEQDLQFSLFIQVQGECKSTANAAI